MKTGRPIALDMFLSIKTQNSDKPLPYGRTNCILAACTDPIGNRHFRGFFFTRFTLFLRILTFPLVLVNVRFRSL